MKKAKNKVKRYIKLAKEKPIQAVYDLLNTLLVIGLVLVTVCFIKWVIVVFKGDILINPIAFNFDGIYIYWYGILFAISFLLGFLYIYQKALRTKQDINLIVNTLFWAVIFGFLGARMVFILLNWKYYSGDLLQVFNIWQGGLSIYGALLGGFLFTAIYGAIRKIDFCKILDLFAPALLLGQMIGRWGNFFNQEIFGYPTNSLLKMYISPINRPTEFRNSAYFHPIFLYESFFCLAILVILSFIQRKKELKSGVVFLYYILLYSVARFFIEFVRIEPKMFMSLTLTQIVCLALIIISAAAILIKNRKEVKHGKSKKK